MWVNNQPYARPSRMYINAGRCVGACFTADPLGFIDAFYCFLFGLMVFSMMQHAFIFFRFFSFFFLSSWNQVKFKVRSLWGWEL